MSGQPLRTSRDAQKFRKAYLASLDVQIANNEKNLQANLLHKRTGQLTTQITDYRTTSQKLADATMLRVDLKRQLRRICDAPNTEQIISSLSDDEVRFVSQNLERIIKELQPKFRYGVDAPHFIVYLNKLIQADEQVGEVIEGGNVRGIDVARELGVAQLPVQLEKLKTFVKASVKGRSGKYDEYDKKLMTFMRVLLELGKIAPNVGSVGSIEHKAILEAMMRATSDFVSAEGIKQTLFRASRLIGDVPAMTQTLDEGVFDNLDLDTLDRILADLMRLNLELDAQVRSNEILRRASSSQLPPDEDEQIDDFRGLLNLADEEKAEEFWDVRGSFTPPYRGAKPAGQGDSSSEEEGGETKGETKGERAEEPELPSPLKSKLASQGLTEKDILKAYDKYFIPRGTLATFEIWKNGRKEGQPDDFNAYYKAIQTKLSVIYRQQGNEQSRPFAQSRPQLSYQALAFAEEPSGARSSGERSSTGRPALAPDLIDVFDDDEVDTKTIDELTVSINDLRLRGLRFIKLRPFLTSEGVSDLDVAETDVQNIRNYYKFVINYLDSRGELSGIVRGRGLKVKGKGYGFGGNEGGSSSLGGKTPARSLHQPNAPRSTYTDMGGSGMKKKKRIKGRGIGVVEGLGVHKKVIFAPFGRFFINLVKLDSDILCFSRKKGTNIPSLKTCRASQALAQVIRKMVNGATPSFNELSALSRQDKEQYNDILRQCQISSGEGLEVPKVDERSDLNQFEIMKGELLSGNDSTELIKKFKVMIIKLIHNGRLPKSEGKSLLMDLAELGY